ncbi:hypothetical protein PGIGA_G00222590, partial [Pangasianodon gigas]|nr:hypothetical protein [Pangasianodon gigas]
MCHNESHRRVSLSLRVIHKFKSPHLTNLHRRLCLEMGKNGRNVVFFPGRSKHPFSCLHTLSISSLSSLSFGAGERVEAGARGRRGAPCLEHAVPHHLYKHGGPELVQRFSLHAGAGGRVHESSQSWSPCW